MSTITKPNTFANGQVIDAVQSNANWDTLYTWANGNVDNANVGTAGIFASQIKPTTAQQATFGGTVGYTFYPAASGQVPLTVSGVSGQSVDLFDVTLTSGGTKQFWVDSAGGSHATIFTSATSATAGTIYLTTNQNRGFTWDGSNYNAIGAGNFVLASGGFLTGATNIQATTATFGGTGVFTGALSATTGTFTGQVAAVSLDVSGGIVTPAALHVNLSADGSGNGVFRNGSNATYIFQNGAGSQNWLTIGPTSATLIGSLTMGALTATTGGFSGALSATTGTFSSTVSSTAVTSATSTTAGQIYLTTNQNRGLAFGASGYTFSGTESVTLPNLVITNSAAFLSGALGTDGGAGVALRTGGTFFLTDAAGVNTLQKTDSSGNFTILGPTATKSVGTAWVNPSDSRIKTNVLPYTKKLAALRQLQPVTFNFNGLGGMVADGKTYVGFIAQTVQAYHPEMVAVQPSSDMPDRLTLDVSDMIPMLVNALKELADKFDAYVLLHP